MIAAAFRTTKGPAGALRAGVDRPRDLFLAGAGRAEDHDPAVGRRDAIDRLAEMVHHPGGADQILRFAGPLLQLGDLAPQPRGFQRTLRDEHQRSALNGFSI